MSSAIGPWPIIMVLLIALVIPILIFALGFFEGKNIGIKKALNEKIEPIIQV